MAGIKTLIVEDDKFLSELMATKLTKEGFQISIAADGESGVAMSKSETPDIILLDIMLPGISGFEVLEQIKADEATKNIPVLILSNFGQESKVKKGMELGAVDYLVKANFTTGEIVEKIKSILGK